MKQVAAMSGVLLALAALCILHAAVFDPDKEVIAPGVEPTFLGENFVTPNDGKGITYLCDTYRFEGESYLVIANCQKLEGIDV